MVRFPILSVLALSVLVVLGSGCTKQARAGRHLRRGDSDVAAGDYDKAEIEYRSALLIVPRNFLAIRQMGSLYKDEGRLPLAYSYLRAASEMQPRDLPLKAKLASVELSLGLTKEARQAAKQILAGDPANEDALTVLIGTSRTKEEQAESLELVQALQNKGPDASAYHLSISAVLLAQGKLDQGEAEVRKALAFNPKSVSAEVELGEILLVRKNPKLAGEAFRIASELSPLRSPRRLMYIDFLLRSGSEVEAKKTLAEMNAKAPDYIPGWVFAMKLALAEHRYDDCAADIKQILAHDLANYDAMMERGMLKLAQGDAPGAITELKKAEDAYKRSGQIKYQLALAYVRDGDLVLAEERLEQAILLEPDLDQPVLALAELKVRKGDPNSAIESLTQLLRRHPQTERAYLLLADAYAAQKNLTQAATAYQRMETLFPKDPQAPFRAGMLLVQQGRRDEARAAFEKALALAPNYTPALEMQVNVDLLDKRYSSAMDQVQRLTGKYPASPIPWLLRAKIELIQRHAEGAETALLKAIDLDPKSQTAYLQLARLYLAMHKPDQAVAKVTALAEKTQTPAALMQLAMLQSGLKKYDAAAATYEKALAINPHFAPALNNLAYLYSEDLNQVDKGYEVAKRARETSPEDPYAADTLGWILFKKKDFHGALPLEEEAVERNPTDGEEQFHLGMAHYMLGEEDPARIAFQHCVDTSTNAATKEEARRRIALIDQEGASGNLADLQKRLDQEPADPIVLARLAGAEVAAGNPASAAKHFEAALALNPRNPRTVMALAQIYSGPLHDPAKARDMAKSAHELAPNDAQTSEMLGRLIYRTGDYKWALDLLQEAERGLPDDRELAYDLALAYYSVGRVTEANSALQQFLTGAPASSRRPEAEQFQAMVAAAASPAQAQAAAAEARRILATNPDSLPALMVAAEATAQQGDSNAAAQAYEQILARDPLFLPATRQLALIYLQRTDSDQKAYDLATRAREAYPEDPDVATTLGILDYRRADYSGSAQLLQESLRERPNDAVTAYYLGMCQYNLKQIDEAKANLQHALDLNLPDRDADEARRVLDELKGEVPGPSLMNQPIN